MFCEDFEREIAEMQAQKIVQGLTMKERAALLSKLIGPLSEKKVVSDREAAAFYLSVARRCTDVQIAEILKVKPSRISALITSATDKIKNHRIGVIS